MRLGLFCRPHEVPGSDLAACVEVARAADVAGLHGFLFGDHLLMTERTDRYPYGAFAHSLDTPWLEPLTTLAAIAAVTRRIRLSTGVLLAPLRPSVLLAKSIATLDVLSRGRVELGVGTGWQREEYEAVGLDWAERNRRLDDAIRICRKLWGEQPVDLSSEHTTLDRVWALPRPVQRRIPLLFGVRLTDANVGRIAELGDGWMPVAANPDDVAAGADRIRHAFAAVGRAPDDAIIHVSVAGRLRADGRLDQDGVAAAAGAMVAAGASVVSVVLPAGLATVDDALGFVADLGACA